DGCVFYSGTASGYIWVTGPNSETFNFIGTPGHGVVTQLAGNGGQAVYVLTSDGTLSGLDYQGYFVVASGVTSFAVVRNGIVIALEADGSGTGNLYEQTAFRSPDWVLIDRLVYSFSVRADGSITVDDWFSRNLHDTRLQALARTDFTRDESITRSDVL